jgi:hypothetical protein
MKDTTETEKERRKKTDVLATIEGQTEKKNVRAKGRMKRREKDLTIEGDLRKSREKEKSLQWKLKGEEIEDKSNFEIVFNHE